MPCIEWSSSRLGDVFHLPQCCRNRRRYPGFVSTLYCLPWSLTGRLLAVKGHISIGTAGTCDDALIDSLARLIAQQLLPMVPELLKEEKPIPVWALKVVEECLESLPGTSIPTLER